MIHATGNEINGIRRLEEGGRFKGAEVLLVNKAKKIIDGQLSTAYLALEQRSDGKTAIGSIRDMLDLARLQNARMNVLLGSGNSGGDDVLVKTEKGERLKFEYYPSVVFAQTFEGRNHFRHLSFDMRPGEKTGKAYDGNSKTLSVHTNPYETWGHHHPGVVVYNYELLISTDKKPSKGIAEPSIIPIPAGENARKALIAYSRENGVGGMGAAFGTWESEITGERFKQTIYPKLTGEGILIFTSAITPEGIWGAHSHIVFPTDGHNGLDNGRYIGGHTRQAIPTGRKDEPNYAIFFPVRELSPK